MQTKEKVKFYKTPDAILQQQLEVYDQVVEKKSADNPMFKEIVASQKAFAERAVQVGHGQQREPAHGLQPLLRPEGSKRRAKKAEANSGSSKTPSGIPRVVFFLKWGRNDRQLAGCAMKGDTSNAEPAVVRR